MSNYGLKVTKDNASTTSTTPNDYVLWSKYKNPKTYIVGTASFNISTEAYSEQNHSITLITHNLGYTPICYLYWSTGGNYGHDYWMTSQGNPHLCYEFIIMNANTTQFEITYSFFPSTGGDNLTNLAGTNFSFKYYIMVDSE